MHDVAETDTLVRWVRAESPTRNALGVNARDLGLRLIESPMTGGGSDGNFTAALGVPTLAGLGIEGARAHTVQAYGLLASLAPRIVLVQRLLEQ